METPRYQQTFVDTYAKVGFAKLYDCKTPLTPQRPGHSLLRRARHSLAACAERRGDGIYCRTHDRHEYELYLAVENIDYGRTKARSPQDPGGRVLIVEDNAIVLESLAAALAQWGYETLAASTGEEALRVAEDERWRIGAIVTDQHLEAGIIGVETAKEIVRRSGRYSPAVILTGDTPGKAFRKLPQAASRSSTNQSPLNLRRS